MQYTVQLWAGPSVIIYAEHYLEGEGQKTLGFFIDGRLVAEFDYLSVRTIRDSEDKLLFSAFD